MEELMTFRHRCAGLCALVIGGVPIVAANSARADAAVSLGFKQVVQLTAADLGDPTAVIQCDQPAAPVPVKVDCSGGSLITVTSTGYDPQRTSITVPLRLISSATNSVPVSLTLELAPPDVPSVASATYPFPIAQGVATYVPASSLGGAVTCAGCAAAPVLQPGVVSPVGSGVAQIATINDLKVLMFQPAPDTVGPVTVSYHVVDDYGQVSGDAKIVFDVVKSETARVPIVINDLVKTLHGRPVTFYPLKNDSDPGTLPLTLVDVDQPLNGSVAWDAGSNAMTFTPDADFSGLEQVTYRVQNSDGGSASGVITIDVGAVAAKSVVHGDIATKPATGTARTVVTDAGGRQVATPVMSRVETHPLGMFGGLNAALASIAAGGPSSSRVLAATGATPAVVRASIGALCLLVVGTALTVGSRRATRIESSRAA
jgi:hypothetical protein